MALIGFDLGGTKLAVGIFDENGNLLFKNELPLAGKRGNDVGELITGSISSLLDSEYSPVTAIGISVPGISNNKDRTVWAPNIPGWDKYPLHDEVTALAKNIPVLIESDRSCYILGEMWKGNAKGCMNAIFVAVGTGIGAGIVADGKIIHGSNDIAGAIGWMALQKPFRDDYIQCGCFETNASGNGIAKMARQFIAEDPHYNGQLKNKVPGEITSHDVFNAYEDNDAVALKVIDNSVQFWGMALANLISIFNPEKIILGGGVFGPAVKFMPQIKIEVLKWAQPISVQQVTIEPSLLGSSAGLYGAGYLALRFLQKK